MYILIKFVFFFFTDLDGYNNYEVESFLPDLEDIYDIQLISRVRRDIPTTTPIIVSTDKPITQTVKPDEATTIVPEQQKNENRINSKVTGSGKLGLSSENEPTSMKKENTTFRDRPLLGINGTGQRKDNLGTVKPIVVSEPINPQTLNKTTILLPNWRQDERPSNLDDELSFDKFDTADYESNQTLTTNNITTFKEDHHIFYNSTTATVDESVINKYWSDLKNLTTSTLLSKSHRRAMVS